MGGQASHWMVLGGSGGIGREIVRQVAPDCAFLDIAGRSRSKVRDALNEARLEGCRARGYAVNLGSLFSLQRMLKWAMRGALPDVVVMAYGPLVEKEMGATTDNDWQKMAMHNLALPGMMASRFLPLMLARGSGTLVFLGGSDTYQISGYRRVAAYSAAKTGLAVVSQSVQSAIDEYASLHGPVNVQALYICPGFVDTEYLDEETRQRYEEISGGMQSVSECAKRIVTLANKASIADNGSRKRQ